MMRAAAMVGLLAAAVFAGCMNGASGPADPWAGHAADDAVLANGWKAGSPTLDAVLGSRDGSEWPGPIAIETLAVDFDGDGIHEHVAHSRDRTVYVFSSTGTVLAELQVPYPPSWNIDQVLNRLSVGQLRPDGPMTLVVTTPASYIIAWEYDAGASSPESFTFHKAWQTRPLECHRSPGMDAKATLADLDGEPGLEILVQTEQVGFYAYRGTGELLWHQCWAGGNADPVAADLDGDGDLEAIFASDSGFISVLDGKTGDPVWTFDASAPPYNIDPASITVAPVVAELDGKAPKEILFSTRYAPDDDPRDFTEFHMAVFAIHQDPSDWQGKLLWMRQPEWAHPLSYTQFIVEDVDGDGRADIFGMDWNTIGHSPGNWEVLGPAHVFRLDADGSDVWVRELETFWSNKMIALADVDGDGQKEVLANGPKGGEDGIWRLDAAAGVPEGFLTTDPWKVTSGPVVVQDADALRLAVAVGAPDDDGTAAVMLYRLDGAA